MKNSYFLPQINHALQQNQVEFKNFRAKEETAKVYGNRGSSTPRSTRVSQTTQISNGTFDLTISRNSSDPFLINYNNQQNRLQNIQEGKYKLLHMRSQLNNVLNISCIPQLKQNLTEKTITLDENLLIKFVQKLTLSEQIVVLKINSIVINSFRSNESIGDVWAIQKLQFTDLVNQTNLIDNKNLKDADVDIKWTATISIGDKGNFRNPERGITRYQLMEVLVRIAEEKYILKTKKSASYFEAISQMWNEHLEKEFTSHSPQAWREQRYWNEECDYCLKNYKPIIDHIYRRHSKKKVKPGQSPFMCLEELNNIIALSGLLNDEKFGSQVANFAFNLSMMTQVDEQTQDRIFQMSIVEFYEALARIAEEANLQPLSGIPNVEDQTQLSYEQRKNLLLAYKLEALIVRLLNTCSDAGFKATQNQITTSFFSASKQNNEQEEEYSYEELSP
ncbi:hypothetical protein ABPG74_005876 [Tetrahymena malaccensis]